MKTRKTHIAAFIAVATFLGASAIHAETSGGATLAGGDNGAAAKTSRDTQVQEGDVAKGSPAATPAPGQSTEHPDGKMRAHKNF